MTDTIQPLIESQLPKQFIYDLGLYLQTCAHIEVGACSLICTLEGHKGSNTGHNPRFHELRKLPLKQLIGQLSESGRHLPQEHQEGLDKLTDWIKRFQNNRHIAAHGAFYPSAHSSTLKVLYTHKFKDHGRTKYRSEDIEIERSLVLELIADADRILRFRTH